MLKIREIQRDSQEGQIIMKQIYDMRFESYTSLGWNPFSKEKSKLVKDEFDESPHTTHFAMFEDARIIASHRATKYSQEEKLPLYNDGYSLEIFQTDNTDISELSRLILRQDKKYPGCVLQMMYNMMKYTLMYKSELICGLGISKAKQLFNIFGAKKTGENIQYIVDKRGGDEMVILNTIPMTNDLDSFTKDLPLDKYDQNRTFVILKPPLGKKDWNNFWTKFSKEAYDYTNLIRGNKQMLARISKLVGINKLVLDAGCGTGNLSALLAKNNSLMCIDYNSSMLQKCKEKLKKYSAVGYKKADVTHLPFEDESFEVITSVNVLYNLEEPILAIKEAYRILKPNGKFIIVSPLKDAKLTEGTQQKIISDCKEDKVDLALIEKLKVFNLELFEKGGLKFTPSLKRIIQLLEVIGFRILLHEKTNYDLCFLIYAEKI